MNYQNSTSAEEIKRGALKNMTIKEWRRYYDSIDYHLAVYVNAGRDPDKTGGSWEALQQMVRDEDEFRQAARQQFCRKHRQELVKLDDKALDMLAPIIEMHLDFVLIDFLADAFEEGK